MSRFQRSKFAVKKNANSGNSLATKLKQARKTGVLNLSNQELDEIPDALWNIHEPNEEERNNYEFGSNDQWWDQVELKKLYLSSNKLKSVSEKLCNFSSLQVLDLQDNQLESLPSELGQLQELEKLSLSHNKLTILSLSFDSAEKLHSIDAMHNMIEKVMPNFFVSLKSCLMLNLSHNKLKSLPTEIQYLLNVSNLNLMKNCLTSLPNEIVLLNNLKVLDLSNNLLESLPSDFSKLKKVEQLNLTQNKLECLPDLSGCLSLKDISLANNKLTEVPKGLPETISILKLSDNKIKILSDEVLLVTKLERLDLTNNDLTQISPYISNMPNLKVLNLDGNPIKSIRRDIINRGSAAVLKYLQTRIPSDQKDKQINSGSLPQSESNMKLTKKHELLASKKVLLEGKTVTEVEQELLQIEDVEIKEIALKKCRLSEVPETVSSYSSSLTKLCLSNNLIKDFSSIMCNFEKLTHLDLCSNSLTTLCQEFVNLQSLMEVNISLNRFSQVPNCLYEIKSLEHLVADSNQISFIDVNGIKKLALLATLSLRNNSINNVPPELGELENIKSLNIDGNLFRVPRQTILQKGTIAVLEYLRSRIVR